jgi:hypothetical protein
MDCFGKYPTAIPFFLAIIISNARTIIHFEAASLPFLYSLAAYKGIRSAGMVERLVSPERTCKVCLIQKKAAGLASFVV